MCRPSGFVVSTVADGVGKRLFVTRPELGSARLKAARRVPRLEEGSFMKNMVKLAVVAAVALGVAACDSRTDNNLASSAENVGDSVGNLAEDAADATVNAAKDVGNAVENGVDAAGNSLEANTAGTENEAAANTTSTNNR
jgi:hypothetical protein